MLSNSELARAKDQFTARLYVLNSKTEAELRDLIKQKFGIDPTADVAMRDLLQFVIVAELDKYFPTK